MASIQIFLARLVRFIRSLLGVPSEPELKKFTRLLVDLVEKPAVRDAFLADPERVMNQRGLTEAQKDALRSRDEAKIKAQVELEYPQANLSPLWWVRGM